MHSEPLSFFKMIKSRKNPPYKNGRPFYTAKQAGVYLIYKSDELVYIGYSQNNVYRTLYRHFQTWNDPTQQRVTYNPNNPNIKVRVIYCAPSRAHKLERALILKYQPADNPNKYELYTFTKKDQQTAEDAEQEFTSDNVDIPF